MVRPWRGSVGVMKHRSRENLGTIIPPVVVERLTLPPHQDPPLGQFLGNPLSAHELLRYFRIGQILKGMQFAPVGTVDIRIGLEVLGFQSVLVEIDDFAFQECHNVGVLVGRSFIGNVVGLHGTGKGHFVVVDIVHCNLDGPIFVAAIRQVLSSVGSVHDASAVTSIDNHRITGGVGTGYSLG